MMSAISGCDKGKTSDSGKDSEEQSSSSSEQEDSGSKSEETTTSQAESSGESETTTSATNDETDSESQSESTSEGQTSGDSESDTQETSTTDSDESSTSTQTSDTSDETTSTGGDLPACEDSTNEDIAVFKVNCLVWQRKMNDKLPWREFEPGIATAPKFCEELSFAGLSEWRLPTIDELNSIVVKGVYPTADLEIFPDTPFGGLWSSEEVAGNHVKVIDFSNGAVATFGTDGPQHFRCVHAAKK